MNLNEFAKEAHKNAVNKGFYECTRCGGSGFSLLSESRKCTNCDGTGKHRHVNIAEQLMLIVTELGEACEAMRKGNHASRETYKALVNMQKDNMKILFEDYIKDSFEDEIADCFIRLADLCGYLNIDIEWHVKEKMSYNKTRPRRHGKEF